MTTKVLSGNYTSYYLTSPITILSITSTGYVGGQGVYTHADPPNTYTVINDGKIAGHATGVYLGDGGLLTNGSATDTVASISGIAAVKLQQAGTVNNFGSIISTAATGFGIYFNEPSHLTNGSAEDTTALIEGNVGVLMPGDMGVLGTISNFGTIMGFDADSIGALISFGGSLTNGSVADTTAEISGAYGVKGEMAATTVTNYGVIQGVGGQPDDAGVVLADGGKVTNGGAQDTAALIQGYPIGVLLSAKGSVNNFGTINTFDETASDGVELAAGGVVVNGAANDVVAQIVGGEGVRAVGVLATVTNFGKIAGLIDTSPGVGLDDGGVVTNGSLQDTLALIVGGRGVDISGAAGTVTNFGTIVGSARAGYFGSPQYAGVNLLDGGLLTNGATGDATALIEGYDGVLLGGASKGVNLARIEAAGGYGVHLYGTASLTNGASTNTGAAIEGWIGAELYNKAILTNFGTVAGEGGVAVSLANTARLNAESGSVFKGQIVGGTGFVDFIAGGFTISGITSGGTVGGAGTVTLDGGVSQFDAGVHLLSPRINVVGAATSVAFDTSLTFAKIWDQSAGTLSVGAGDKASFSGAGDSFSGTIGGPGQVGFTSGSDMLGAVTLAALTTISAAATVTLSGAVVLSAEMEADTANLVVAAGGATLSGTGQLNLGSAATDSLHGASTAAKLTDNGSIVGSGLLGAGEMILAVGAKGSVENSNATALTIDTGANTIANAGTISGGVIVKSAIDNTGTLYSPGGTLTLDGAVTGSGIGKINGGTLDFASTFAENVTFIGNGVLELAKSQTYTGTLTGFSKTGTTSLDLGDITFGGATKASYSGTAVSGVLTVTDGTHTAKIKLTGNYTASVFTLSSDGHGGTKVVDPIAPAAPHAFIAAMAGLGAAGDAAPAMPDASRPPEPLILGPGTHTA